VEITDGMLLAESLEYARLIVNSDCTEVIEVMKQGDTVIHAWTSCCYLRRLRFSLQGVCGDSF
jgi:hypothetical protein